MDVAVGFAALKVLGPFAEAFASKLGERLGESTAQAVSRIRLLARRHDHRGEPHGGMLAVRTGDELTMVVLPAELADDARLALIDIDPTVDGVRGAVLHWDPVAGAWHTGDPTNDAG
jgi:hypothetical protein